MTPLARRLGLRVPIVQAPMAGGPSTVALAAAASEAGALGSLAAGYVPVARLRDDVAELRRRTSGPFAVNLFAPSAPVDGEVPPEVMAAVNRLRAEVDLPPLDSPPAVDEDLDEAVAVLVDARPAMVSFTFGLLPAASVDALHEAGCLLMGTATTVAEAVALERAGCDAVCAQGVEAGGHRGAFLPRPGAGLVGTMALVPQVCDAVGVPVVAAGGIGDGRGVLAALALGAEAAQVGTAFMRCPEAGTPPAHRAALATADEASTALTGKVTGKPVRGIANRLMRELEPLDVPPWPVMQALTAELRRAAARRGEPELMALWAGQAVPLATDLPAAEVVERLAATAAARLEALRDM